MLRRWWVRAWDSAWLTPAPVMPMLLVPGHTSSGRFFITGSSRSPII